MNVVALADPAAVRKAAAFVEALREVEERFGYRLELDDPALITLADGTMTGFALAEGPTSLVLALTTPEPGA